MFSFLFIGELLLHLDTQILSSLLHFDFVHGDLIKAVIFALPMIYSHTFAHF